MSTRARDRFGLRDILTEAGISIAGRPGRLVLTILGTVLGIASVVVTIGLAQTAAGQIAKRFDAVAATSAVFEPKTNSMGNVTRDAASLPWDSQERMERLAGVEAAGLVAAVDVAGATITAVPLTDPTAASPVSPQVIAASDGIFEAIRATLGSGRWFDAGHDERGDPVVVLGSRAAERLGVFRVDNQPSIFIGDKAYSVIGILSDSVRRTDFLDAVIMPLGTARADFGLRGGDQVQVRMAIGAGPVLGTQGPLALSPNSPENITARVPVTSQAMQSDVQADVSAIFLALGAVALLVGGLGIANITLLSVFERVGEIGLRRALGATRTNIAAQFLVESVIIGLLGGLIGAAIGVLVVLGVSVAQEWTPILDLRVTIGAALLGGIIGLVAGLYPSLKAANIEPIAALRAGL